MHSKFEYILALFQEGKTEKAKKEFGFEPKINIEEGISEMAKWSIENLPDIKTYSNSQLPPRRGYTR